MIHNQYISSGENKTNKVIHDLRILEGLCKQLQRTAQSTTLSLGGLIQPGCLFVGIGHFDDSSNTDRLMKNSEHPFLQTILNLTLERLQSSDSWMLVSLLPDLEVSDLEK